MSAPDDAQSRDLLHYGRRDLEGRSDPALNLVRYQTELGTWHDPRDSVWYALPRGLGGEDPSSYASRYDGLDQASISETGRAFN